MWGHTLLHRRNATAGRFGRLNIMAKGTGSYIRVKDKAAVLKIKYCTYCGSAEDLAIDHILSPIHGGDSHRNNLTRACCSCNSMKSDLSVFDFSRRTETKREHLYGRICGYLSHMEKDKRRQGYVRENVMQIFKRDWVLFKRYSRIINSIHTEKYILFNG